MIHPPMDDVMTEAGLQEVETYIYRRQNTVAQLIVTKTIMELCLAVDQIPGPRIYKRWW